MPVHPLWLAAMAMVLLVVVGPIVAIVLIVQRSGRPSVQPGVHVSQDGNWWWDGQRWISTVSEDGRWRWNGREWQAIQPGG
jgi:hypothetical protein